MCTTSSYPDKLTHVNLTPLFFFTVGNAFHHNVFTPSEEVAHENKTRGMSCFIIFLILTGVFKTFSNFLREQHKVS